MNTKAVTCLIVSLLMLGGCIPKHVSEEDKVFSQVYDAQGFTKDILFEKITIWMMDNLKSSKPVLDYQDKENGTVMGNGSTAYPCDFYGCTVEGKSNWKVLFAMRAEVKDNKFRLTFSNLQISWPESINKYTGYMSAKSVPMIHQEDYDLAKPILLNYGVQIQENLKRSQQQDKW